MMSEHYQFEMFVNATYVPGELHVMFSGRGKPCEGHKIGTAIYDYFLVHTIRSGRGTYICNGQVYPCEEGDTFFIWPGIAVSYEADVSTPWEYAWVGFSGQRADELVHLIGVTPERPITHGADDQIIRYYDAMRTALEDHEFPTLANQECSAYARLLLMALGRSNRANIQDKGRHQTEAEKRIRNAASLMKMQYATPISIEALADQLGYHRVYFSNMFKQFIGKSPKQYLLDVRMEQAELLLASTSLSIEQVAESVGYNDSLYFSRHYQKWSGSSPSTYRKSTK